jgi:uncharacterized protein (DUF58 family)
LRTGTGGGLIGAASIFLVMALAMHRWEIASLILPLILMVALAPFMLRRTGMDLVITRTFDLDRPQKGEEVEVTLTIENRGGPFSFAHLEDVLPQGVVLASGMNHLPIAMARGATATVRYTLKVPGRGRFLFDRVSVTSTDPLFGSSRSTVHRLEGQLEVTPRVQEMRRITIQPVKVRMHAGNIRSKLLGPGTEFFALRDYRSGDSLRHVNWKASARRDRLLTNEYETERSGDVTIIVDARTIEGGENLEATIEAAASLSSYFLRARDRVGMIIVGEVVDVIRSYHGKRQMQKIMDHLTETRPGLVRSALSIRLALGRYFREDSMLLLITTLNDPGMVETAKELIAKGHHLVVISPRPIRKGGVEDRAEELVHRMAGLRRADALYELGNFCRVVDWETERPLMTFFQEVRARQPDRTR